MSGRQAGATRKYRDKDNSKEYKDVMLKDNR